MLIKVGRFYLTLGTFTLYEVPSGDYHLILAGNLPIVLEKAEALEITAALDKMIAAQKTVEEIIAAQRAQDEQLNIRAAQLNAQIEQVTAYENDLKQKAAELDAAHAAMKQQKSPVILPPGFGKIRK